MTFIFVLVGGLSPLLLGAGAVLFGGAIARRWALPVSSAGLFVLAMVGPFCSGVMWMGVVLRFDLGGTVATFSSALLAWGLAVLHVGTAASGRRWLVYVRVSAFFLVVAVALRRLEVADGPWPGQGGLTPWLDPLIASSLLALYLWAALAPGCFVCSELLTLRRGPTTSRPAFVEWGSLALVCLVLSLWAVVRVLTTP